VADSIDPAAKLKTGDARDNKLGTVIGQVTFPIGKQKSSEKYLIAASRICCWDRKSYQLDLIERMLSLKQ
jgi:hypothetical protein